MRQQPIRCQQCRFWNYLSEGETDIGHCHRYAPRSAPEDVMGEASAFWPHTRANDWCGEAELWRDEPKPNF